MRSQTSLPKTDDQTDDMTLAIAVANCRAGMDGPLTRIMQAHNQRLFRIARSILRDDCEAEDIVQETFIKAFSHAGELRDQARTGAWLGSIAVNLARDRLRSNARRAQVIETTDNLDVIPFNRTGQDDHGDAMSPERQAAMSDVRRLIETQIDALPDGFREVFMLRIVEQMSVTEAADLLDLEAATVKSRLHRARSLLRQGLEGQLSAQSLRAFPFGGVHCARTTAAVIQHLQGGDATGLT